MLFFTNIDCFDYLTQSKTSLKLSIVSMEYFKLFYIPFYYFTYSNSLRIQIKYKLAISDFFKFLKHFCQCSVPTWWAVIRGFALTFDIIETLRAALNSLLFGAGSSQTEAQITSILRARYYISPSLSLSLLRPKDFPATPKCNNL